MPRPLPAPPKAGVVNALRFGTDTVRFLEVSSPASRTARRSRSLEPSRSETALNDLGLTPTLRPESGVSATITLVDSYSTA